jgi:hypothetical protein
LDFLISFSALLLPSEKRLANILAQQESSNGDASTASLVKSAACPEKRIPKAITFLETTGPEQKAGKKKGCRNDTSE